MEIVFQIASTAIKAMRGEEQGGSESKTEPISGALGEVSKGEPYDAGNLDQETQRKLEQGMANGDADSSPTSSRPVEKTAGGEDYLGESGDAAEGSAEPGLHGKGPRPLDEVAREHGGNAAEGEKAKRQEVVEPSTAGGEEAEKKKNKESENRGTGEHYVKTTGLAADGGDFDASKPGAGREAERLMDQKGMRHGDDGKKGDTSGLGKDKDKPSLGERIKNKLHKH